MQGLPGAALHHAARHSLSSAKSHAGKHKTRKSWPLKPLSPEVRGVMRWEHMVPAQGSSTIELQGFRD